jgi:hypothetical protein
MNYQIANPQSVELSVYYLAWSEGQAAVCRTRAAGYYQVSWVWPGMTADGPLPVGNLTCVMSVTPFTIHQIALL